MVYKYKGKSEQQSWDAGAMQRAIEEVTNDEMRSVLGKNIDAEGNRKVLGKYRAVFTEEQEAELIFALQDTA
ncbi:hypothetical protein JTB14_035940 [Gonioctena quinquepunctata]|nr:hypothetical protein JTB14_035940 [Gonioctena quinquepunctata]